MVVAMSTLMKQLSSVDPQNKINFSNFIVSCLWSVKHLVQMCVRCLFAEFSTVPVHLSRDHKVKRGKKSLF